MLVKMLSSTYNGAMLLEAGDVYDFDAGYAQRLIDGGQAVLAMAGQTQSPAEVARLPWANRVAGLYLGEKQYFSDIGNGFVEAVWNGAAWVFGNTFVLKSDGTTVATTATTSEETLGSILIPGGLMGLNSAIRIKTLWSMTGTAGIKTPRIKFASLPGTPVFEWASGATAGAIENETTIRNANSLTAQVAYFQGTSSGLGNTTASNIALAVNTSADQTINITGQKASAADGFSLRGYTVEIIPF
jgi:hypothetical protein